MEIPTTSDILFGRENIQKFLRIGKRRFYQILQWPEIPIQLREGVYMTSVSELEDYMRGLLKRQEKPCQ